MSEAPVQNYNRPALLCGLVKVTLLKKDVRKLGRSTLKKNTLLGPYIKEKYIFQLESQCISWQK